MCYYSVRQAAEILQVKERTICRWIKSGRLAASKLGGSKLFRLSREELMQFIERNRVSCFFPEE